MEKLLKQVIQKYGKQSQKIKAVEEFSELIQAISKDLNGKGDRANIIEEIVDSQIMLKQIGLVYEITESELDDMLEKKIEKMNKLLNLK